MKNLAASLLKDSAAVQAAKLVNFHLTFGPYDAVTVLDAKDDESMAAFTLATGSLGNVSTLTMRAFNETEYKAIISKLP